jgi:beta-galactosidase
MSSRLRRSDSPAIPLDQMWRFCLLKRPQEVTADHLSGSTASWAAIEVPGCWTMQGFGQPQYTNVQMPFPGPPPRVPYENPTGVYRRAICIPSQWEDKRVVLRVGGAESALAVHLDGRPVGMGKDSRLDQEFDLTQFLRAGDGSSKEAVLFNLALTGVVEPGVAFELALTVVRWSDATYLEDQDHWYHAGLHRSVELYSTPVVHIGEVHAVCDYDPGAGSGRLVAEIRVDSATDQAPPKDWTITAAVAGRQSSATARFEHRTDWVVNVARFTGRGATIELADLEVEPWSAESPTLYELSITLSDANGNPVDAVQSLIGFRRVEIRGNQLTVNGVPILLKGVNRHDHDPQKGKAVTRESIERDVILMKRHNLNAIRTSHYPNDPFLYETCDRLGMYVVDEANIESHGYLRSLTRDPMWATPMLERIMRMALRDHRHPSIIMWSLGNESGVSPAHLAGAAWLRSFDPTRPVHYEGGISEDELGARARGEDPDLCAILATRRPESDVVAPMYPPVEAIVAWARSVGDRPLVMCEYCHAMGNSCGGLDEYWEAIRAHRALQGGFIWDWADQALVQQLPDGSVRLAYGGDFGDDPNDGAFCMNGLVSAERVPHPSAIELSAVLQPVQISIAASGGTLQIELRNEYECLDLGHLQARFAVLHDGDETASGVIDLPPIAPQSSARLDMPPLRIRDELVSRVDLDLSLHLRQATEWAPKGHQVAFQQLTIEDRGEDIPPPTWASARTAPLGVAQASFARLQPQLALWRAPIDNERFGPRHGARWEEIGLRSAHEMVPLTTELEDDGTGLRVTHSVVVPEAFGEVARVGVRLLLGRGIDSVEWLGLGPHECYSDRRTSGHFGRYRTAVEKWAVPYVHPQSSGNRMGVRWAAFLGVQGEVRYLFDQLALCGTEAAGRSTTARAGLELTVSRHTDEEVADASHLEELARSQDCYLWIDARHRGVGSGACGPDTAAAHRVEPGSYTWSYRVRAGALPA